MVPNTFEAATIVSLPDNERKYDYAAGYVWNVKHRDSNDFIPMSAALAGSDAINRGAPFGMVRYRPTDGLSLVAMDYNVQDFINAGFAQIEYDFKQPAWIPNWRLAQTSSISEALSQFAHGQSFPYLSSVCEGADGLSGVDLILGRLDDRSGIQPVYRVRWKPQLHWHRKQLLFDNANEKRPSAAA
jgi:hypothetical protein